MIRLFPLMLLSVIGFCVGGCSEGGSAIYAAAPAGSFTTHYTVQGGGRFTLFRVTEWKKGGEPKTVERLASYDLRPGEKLGFDWVTDRARMYEPDAALNVIAYAGSHRTSLGPIVSRSERYFWADANGWNLYWSGEQQRELGKAIMLK